MNQQLDSVVARRALVPEVLFLGDIAVALDLPMETVEHYLPEGTFGQVLHVAGRPAVLRDSFLEALAARAHARSAEGKEVLRGL